MDPVNPIEPLERRTDLLGAAIARPVSVFVGVVLVLLFGVLAIGALPIQLTPDITVPTMTVTTQWPGATPIEVESEIVEPQEDALKSVPGLVKLESEVKPDEGKVTLEFEVGTDLGEALVEVSNALSQVPEYPLAAREPIISRANSSGPPVAVISIQSLHEEGRVAQYRTWVDQQIVPRIERVRGVASVIVRGGRERRIVVDFDMADLAARRITVQQVASRIGAELRDVSGGDLDLGKQRYLVRTPVAPREPEALEQVIIGVGPDDTPIRLGDVARVRAGFRKPTGVAMSDNGPSMVLLLFREAGTNVLELSQEVRALVDTMNRERFAPEGLEIRVVSDQVGYITRALALVRNNLLVGAALASLVLLVFLRSFAASAVVGLAIPVCVLGTALGMQLLGRTINVVSLAGTAFAVGMVVDNSIVALECIDAWRRRGVPPIRAAYYGVREVSGALMASTATTAAVFLPIISWQGEVGELLRDIAVAIALAVGVSLVVSLLVIPSLSARLLRPRPAAASGRGLGPAFAGFIARQVYFVTRRWPRALLVVIVAVTAAIGAGYSLLPAMEYLPPGNRNLVFGLMVAPPGSSPAELERIATRVQGHMAEHAGTDVDSVPALQHTFFLGDPGRIIYGAVAQDPERASELLPFVREVGASSPGVSVFASQDSMFDRSIGGARAVEVEISGSDLVSIVQTGERLMTDIAAVLPGAQVRPVPSLDLGAPEIHAVPLRGPTAGLAVSGAELGLMIDAYVDGAVIGDLGPRGEPKVDVVLRALEPGGREVDDPEALASAPVATPSGDLAPLSSLARIEEHLGPTLIKRIERRRAVTLQVTPPQSVPLERAMQTIVADVIAPLEASSELDSETQLRIAGVAGKLDGAKERLGLVLLLAVVISFLLLAALFEDFVAPVAVLVTIPLAAGGGALGLWCVDRFVAPQTFDLLTAMGFVILIGVVVNNAILVVDGARTRLEVGASLDEAIAEAVKARVRPIFMSTMTSLAGLLPLVLFPGSGAELYRGVGAVVLGGLAVSTVLTLYVVPCALALLWRGRGAVVPRRARRGQTQKMFVVPADMGPSQG